MAYDQHDTPYVDAMLRYRQRGFTPFHTPGHKLGKGAPDKLRELLGADLPERRRRHGRRRRGHARVDAAHPPGRGLRRRGLGRGPRLVPGQRLDQRHARAHPHPVRPGRNGRHPRATRTSPCWPGSSSAAPGRRTSSPRSTTSGASRSTSRGRRAARAGGAPRGQGAPRDLAHLQRHRRRPRGDRRARARRRRALRRRPGLGPAPALLQPAARRRHERRRRRRRGQHAQAHQRHHAVLGAPGARHAPQPGQARGDGASHPEHEPPGPHVRLHRRRAPADGDAGRGALARRHRARRLGARRAQRHHRRALPGARDPATRRRGRVRPDAGDRLHRTSASRATSSRRSCATTTASRSRWPTRSTWSST